MSRNSTKTTAEAGKKPLQIQKLQGLLKGRHRNLQVRLKSPNLDIVNKKMECSATKFSSSPKTGLHARRGGKIVTKLQNP